jgi:predicted dehydrogenase
MENQQRIRYAIIGGGFRAGFYLRVALEVPQLFEVCGIATSIPERTVKLRTLMGVKAYKDVEELLRKETPEFLVVCTQRSPNTLVEPMEALVPLGLPILLETPAAWNIERLFHIYEVCRGRKVQIAEQLHVQPETAARIKIARSGLLGTISHVELSFQHTYHCMNILRRFFALKYENAEIYAKRYRNPVVQGYMRGGISETEKLVEENREFALLDFNGKLGIYDYEDNQVRSYVRSEHIAVRGERGEISDRRVSWLETQKDFRSYTYERLYSGSQTSLEGFYFRGLMGGGQWLFRNPYDHAHFADDDIAVASMLEKMAVYVRGGESFSSVAEACQDQYLSLMIEKSAIEGRPVITETQPWAAGN